MGTSRRNRQRLGVAFIIVLLTGCSTGTAPQFAPSSAIPSGAPAARFAARGKLGPVLTAPENGTITGWDVSATGDYGLLSAGYKKGTALEAFDLKTAKVTTIGTYQAPDQGKFYRQLIVLKILADGTALVDDLAFDPQNFHRDDSFPTADPAQNAKTTGRWTPPHRENLLVEWVAVNQATPTNAIVVDHNHLSGRGGGLQLLLSGVAAGGFAHPIRIPPHEVFEPPYLVAQDTATGQTILPAQLGGDPFNPFIPPEFDIYDKTGKYTIFFPQIGSGSVMGIAIDPATHTMCSTTSEDSDVEFYDLKAKTGFAVTFPGLTGEGLGGGAVAVDPLHHLFIVTQPSAASGGSIVYAYDEKGNLQEEITGFNFPNRYSAVFAYVAVNPKLRIGYATGPSSDQIQSFTY